MEKSKRGDEGSPSITQFSLENEESRRGYEPHIANLLPNSRRKVVQVANLVQNRKGSSLKDQAARDGDVGGSHEQHLASKAELMLSSHLDGPDDSFPRFTSPPMLSEANVGGVEQLVGGGGNAIAVCDGNFLVTMVELECEFEFGICHCNISVTPTVSFKFWVLLVHDCAVTS